VVRWLFVFLIVVVVTPAEGQQFFEGTLLYQHSIESKKLSVDSLKKVLPKASLYLYRAEFYKGYVFALDTTVYIYHGGLGICMVKASGDATVYCADYNKKIYEPQKIVVDRKQHNVNGYPCVMITSVFKNYKVRSWYHTGLKHYPEMFSKHKAYGYTKLMKAARGGIFVKSEIVYDNYTMTIELVNINERQIPENEFAGRLFDDCLRR
jgi:hypothetical protein